MNEKLTKELQTLFPKLVEQIGFCHGDGWYNIISDLLLNIHNEVEKKSLSVKICQIKEKFGTLRVYVDGSNEFIAGLIQMAESISGHTCEICGKPGEIDINRNWYKTLCKFHQKRIK